MAWHRVLIDNAVQIGSVGADPRAGVGALRHEACRVVPAAGQPQHVARAAGVRGARGAGARAAQRGPEGPGHLAGCVE